MDKVKKNPFYNNDVDEFDANTFDVPQKKLKPESLNECNQLDQDEMYAKIRVYMIYF